MIAGPSPVFCTNSYAPFGVTNVEISTCGQTSARSWARWSWASYKPTATAETLTTRAATAMNVSGSRYQGRSPFIWGECTGDLCRSERRRSESNRRIEVLQTSALPLGYGAGRNVKSQLTTSSARVVARFVVRRTGSRHRLTWRTPNVAVRAENAAIAWLGPQDLMTS